MITWPRASLPGRMRRAAQDRERWFIKTPRPSGKSVLLGFGRRGCFTTGPTRRSGTAAGVDSAANPRSALGALDSVALVAGEETALKVGWFNRRRRTGLAKLGPISSALACLHDIDEVVLFDHETQEAANRLCLFVVEHLEPFEFQSRSFLFFRTTSASRSGDRRIRNSRSGGSKAPRPCTRAGNSGSPWDRRSTKFLDAPR